MRKIYPIAFVAALAVAGCSEKTQDAAQTTAERAAADAKVNAEVVGEQLREGTAKAAGEVSEGAAALQERLDEDGERQPRTSASSQTAPTLQTAPPEAEPPPPPSQ